MASIKIKYDYHSRICEQCGKQFFVPDYDTYVYRRNHRYFCKWSCMRKWDQEHEQSNTGAQTCDECIWFSDKYGFQYCTFKDWRRATHGKRCCKYFMKREEEDEE